MTAGTVTLAPINLRLSPLNRLSVDAIVLCVRTDNADVNNPAGVINPDAQPIFIASDIKGNATVTPGAGASIVSLHVRWRGPVRPEGMAVPGQHGFPGVFPSVLVTKRLEG